MHVFRLSVRERRRRVDNHIPVLRRHVKLDPGGDDLRSETVLECDRFLLVGRLVDQAQTQIPKNVFDMAAGWNHAEEVLLLFFVLNHNDVIAARNRFEAKMAQCPVTAARLQSIYSLTN